MSATRVRFPSYLSTAAALRFGRTLRDLPLAESYEIDFSGCRWIEPFSALIASSELGRFKLRIANRPIEALNFQHMDYAAHIGFFRSFGLGYGNSPGQVPGGPSYQPINVMSSDQIRDSAERRGMAVGAVMEECADQLAGLLCRSDSSNVFDTLSYSMREIMRNVVEHSGGDRIAYCGQYWPSKARVEVAVMDWGVGIKRGLSENPKLAWLQTDEDALRLALMPGVSGKAEVVKKLRQKTFWTNSGYGLYMTSRLCRTGGSFLIGSGTSALVLSGQDILPMTWGVTGTSIRLQMNISNLNALGSQLERFRREAYKFREDVGESEFLTASMASRVLSREFSA